MTFHKFLERSERASEALMREGPGGATHDIAGLEQHMSLPPSDMERSISRRTRSWSSTFPVSAVYPRPERANGGSQPALLATTQRKATSSPDGSV